MAKAQSFSYVEYTRRLIDRVRGIKADGGDVTEYNRLLQSLVSAVETGDFVCADYMIYLLEEKLGREAPFIDHDTAPVGPPQLVVKVHSAMPSVPDAQETGLLRRRRVRKGRLGTIVLWTTVVLVIVVGIAIVAQVVLR